VLHDGHLEPGFHERVWDGLDERGRSAASGMYFLRLRSPDRVDVRRLVRTR